MHVHLVFEGFYHLFRDTSLLQIVVVNKNVTIVRVHNNETIVFGIIEEFQSTSIPLIFTVFCWRTRLKRHIDRLIAKIRLGSQSRAWNLLRSWLNMYLIHIILVVKVIHLLWTHYVNPRHQMIIAMVLGLLLKVIFEPVIAFVYESSILSKFKFIS